MFKVEKGIPIPKPEWKDEFPFSAMEIGDSFFVPVEPGRIRENERSRISAHARRFFNGVRHVTIRTQSDGLRVWRVK